MIFRLAHSSLVLAILVCGLHGSVAQDELRDTARDAPKAVVELFTSQGCASCPPADALLTELGGRLDVIALGYHVDYWDYAGWPDTFGAEANSNRQRAYAARWGSGRIYTPQMVVNGTKGVVGSRRADVTGAVREAGLVLPVSIATDRATLHIDIEGQAGLDEAVVWLVTTLDQASVAIEQGENQGARIDYTHVVTGRQAVGVWDPGSGLHVKLPLAEVLVGQANGVAVLVQQEANGLPDRILGAASIQP